MKISELSERSGVPIPTIKYYIREGLLPGGRRTSANQAQYDQEHLERLRLVRSLRDVADLGVATIKQTLEAIDAAAAEPPELPALAVALRALGGPRTAGGQDAGEEAHRRVDRLLDDLGWQVPPESAARSHLARALAAIDHHWHGGVSAEMLAAYARLAGELAQLEIPQTWDPHREPGEALRYAVLGTVLFEPVILSLRRLAHIDRSHRLAARRGGSAPSPEAPHPPR